MRGGSGASALARQSMERRAAAGYGDGASRVLRARPGRSRWRRSPRRRARSWRRRGADADTLIDDVKPLADAGPRDLAFFDNRKYLPIACERRAPAPAWCCRRSPIACPPAPDGWSRTTPYRGFRPGAGAVLSRSRTGSQGAPRRAPASASIRPPSWKRASSIEPGAIIGAEAHIGRGTRIAAGAVIGYRVTIGRGCYIGPLAHRRRTPWSATGSSSMPACASARTASASPWAGAATSRCRRSAGSSSRTTSRSAPTTRRPGRP